MCGGDAVREVIRYHLITLQDRDLVLFVPEPEVFLHIGLRLFGVGHIAVEAAIIGAILAAVELTLEVIITRRAFLIAISLATEIDHFLHPPVFRLRRNFDGGVAMFAGIVDALSLIHI